MEEIWKDVKGYEGIYQVSNLGRVKSVDRLDKAGKFRSEKVLSISNDKGGYRKVILTNNGRSDNRTIHRLVAQTFIPNTENKPQVNHIDEDKTNNNVDNLEWVTAKENMNHGTAILRSSSKQSKPILCKTNKVVYKSIAEASRMLGINAGTISKIVNGKMNKTQGFTFEYKEV